MTKIIPITPKKNPFPTGGELRSAIYKAVNETAEEIAKKYERSWATWEHKPEANVEKTSGYERRVTVGGENAKIFTFVDKGTSPHRIRAKNRRVLAFSSKYTPKSIPGNLVARRGGPSGELVLRPSVMHPGSKPRNISKKINEKSEKLLAQNLRKYLGSGGYIG